MPNCSASYTGFMSAFISISQALHEPVSTSRIASDCLKGLAFSLTSGMNDIAPLCLIFSLGSVYCEGCGADRAVRPKQFYGPGVM